MNNLSREWIPPALVLLFFFLLWEGGVRYFSVPTYLLPSPSQIFNTMIVRYNLLLEHAAVTLGEVLVGFGVAFISGVGLALSLFYWKALQRALYPLLVASQTIPVFAIAPLLIFWFGYGLWSKVIMAAIIVFFPIAVNTLDGLKSADPHRVNLLLIMGANRWQILTKVRFPSALPFLFSGAKIGIAVSIIGAVIGEWVGARNGLGYLMIHANAQLQISLVFASIFWLSLLGVGLFSLVSVIERWMTPWRRAKS